MTREEAIQKALKLMKLAESSNVHEAALAAQRAQELLMRFEISQEVLDAEGTGPREKEEPIAMEAEPLEKPSGRLATWKSYLAGALGKANQCRTFCQMKYGQASIVILGRTTDARTVRYLYSLMCSEVERLTKANTKGMGRTYANNFRMGVVDAIAEKLREADEHAKEQMRQEVVNNATALMRVDQAIARRDAKAEEVDAYVKSNLKTSSSRYSHRSDQQARSHGREVGNDIQMNVARGALASPAPKVAGRSA